MKWVTRKNASVDRIACPWLIKRFIDPEAEFLYVAAPDVAAVAEREGAEPYDVAGVGLGHVGGRFRFGSIIVKYRLNDPALDRLDLIGQVAHVASDLAVTPEAAGLEEVPSGFAL